MADAALGGRSPLDHLYRAIGAVRRDTNEPDQLAGPIEQELEPWLEPSHLSAATRCDLFLLTDLITELRASKHVRCWNTRRLGSARRFGRYGESHRGRRLEYYRCLFGFLLLMGREAAEQAMEENRGLGVTSF